MIILEKVLLPARRSAPLVFSATFFSKSDDELPGYRSSHDVENTDREQERLNQSYDHRDSLDWRQRLELMWRLDEEGDPSPELSQVWFCVQGSFFVGGCVGAFIDSRDVIKKFMEKNKYEMFKHPREAQVALRDRILLCYLQGFWRLGWRMGLLTGLYMSAAQSLTAIRNKVNPLDHAAGGAVMGAVYKYNFGLRGMAAGGLLGGVLGLQGGLLFWVMQFFSGETVEDRWKQEFIHRFNVNEAKKKEEEDERQKMLDDSPRQQVSPEEEEKEVLEGLSPVTQIAHRTKKWLEKFGLLQPELDVDDRIVVNVRGADESSPLSSSNYSFSEKQQKQQQEEEKVESSTSSSSS